MANSTTNLDLIQSSQAQKEITANALFDAASPATCFGRRAKTTTGLSWGLYGGNVIYGGVNNAFSNSVITLTANTTNYIQFDIATLAVIKNTTGFLTNNTPLYTVITNTSAVTSYTDHRAYLKLITGEDLPVASETVLGAVKVDGTTITIDEFGVISAVGGSGGTSISFKENGTELTANLASLNLTGTNFDITQSGDDITINSDQYVLPTASTSVLGGVKVDGTSITAASGVISATPYSLPTASTSILGGVKVDGTSITAASGVISATGIVNDYKYDYSKLKAYYKPNIGNTQNELIGLTISTAGLSQYNMQDSYFTNFGKVIYQPNIHMRTTATSLNVRTIFTQTSAVGLPKSNYTNNYLYFNVGPDFTTTNGTANSLFFCGLSDLSTGTTLTSTTTNAMEFVGTDNAFGICWRTTDSNLQVVYKNAAGTTTFIDLGSNFKIPNSLSTIYDSYEILIKAELSKLNWSIIVTNKLTGNTTTQNITIFNNTSISGYSVCLALKTMEAVIKGITVGNILVYNFTP